MGARRAARGGRWRAAALGLVLPALLRAQLAVPSLSSIPVDQLPALQAPPPPGAALRVRVQVADAPGLARLLGEPEPAAGPAGAAGWLALRLPPGGHADVGGPADGLASSFIVDHDDPAVRQLAAQLQAGRARAGAPPPPGPPAGAEVVAFVARHMRTHYEANASLASEVARSLRGDCTEYALLTAALARALGLPARMVQGVALVQAEGRWQAYGHAWAQTLEEGRWTLRDSALAGFPGPVYYLPFAAMDDEGPGHRLTLLRAQGRLPQRIEVLGPEAPAPR